MSEDATVKPIPQTGPASPAANHVGLARWQIGLLGFAGVLTVAGLGLSLLEGGEGAPSVASTSASPGIAQSLLPAGLVASSSTPAATDPLWSSGLFRMGMSFFLGFAVGYLLRVFLKSVLLLVGALFLILAGLEQIELVTVHWDAVDRVWGEFSARIGTDFEHFTTVLTGRLPQAGLGGLGIFAGFKKR